MKEKDHKNQLFKILKRIQNFAKILWSTTTSLNEVFYLLLCQNV